MRSPLFSATWTIPLIGQVKAWDALTRPHAIVKPERQMGAVWMDGFVARRKNVNLCELCWRKYYGWWNRAGYHPDWDERWLTDCDGCSRRLIHCYGFYPEESIYKVMTERHGCGPAPK